LVASLNKIVTGWVQAEEQADSKELQYKSLIQIIQRQAGRTQSNIHIDRQTQTEGGRTKYTGESGLNEVNTGGNDNDRTRNRWLIGE